MLIGYDASRAFIKERTGTENYSYFLLKEMLLTDKHNAYRIFLRPPVAPSQKAEYQTWFSKVKESLPKTNNYTFHVIYRKRLWTQWGLARALKRKKVDVLFVPAHTLPLLRPKKLKTVVTIHDLGYEYLPQYHRFPHRLWLTYFTEYAAHQATKLIAVSEATKQDLVAKFTIPQAKIQVVYEGYSPGTALEVKRVTQELEKLELAGTPYLLAVGTIQPRKNYARLIEAFSQAIQHDQVKKLFPEMKLVIAGKSGWLDQEIYNAPRRYGVEDKVIFTGYVSDETAQALLRESRGLVFPSLFEGFGLPIIEAQHYGIPVLTSEKNPMMEVGGQAALYVDPESVDEIAQGIVQLVTDESKRKYLTSHAKENVKRFSWKIAARETIQVLEEAVKER